jgi:putative transposase
MRISAGCYFDVCAVVHGVWVITYSPQLEEALIIIRQLRYLKNLVEQDHRVVKRVTRPMLGFKSFDTTQGTLAGVELMHMIKKGQLGRKEGEESLTPAAQFYALAV